MASSVAAQDWQAIHELIARAYRAFDAGDADDYVSLWIDDCKFLGFGDPIEGKEGLKGLCNGTLQQTGGKWRHHLTNTIVTATGPLAARIEGLALVSCVGETPSIQLIVDVRYDCQKIDGAWMLSGALIEILN